MPKLLPGEVHIWTARWPPNPAQELENKLSQTEREAARRFRLAKHRSAYVFAHAALRDILSQYLLRSPEKIQLHRGSFGKPFLVDGGPQRPPLFSMSHSGEVVLIALAGERHIGVDVEEIRPLKDFMSIARSCFTPLEQAFVLSHAPEDRERGFYRCWTRKEAYIKAIGRGLSIPLRSFDTSIAVGQPGRRLPRSAEASEIESWWLADIDVPAGYLGAVTVEKGFDRLVYSEWTMGEL